MTDLLETTGTKAMARIARAALNAVDRTAFLPTAARESAQRLNATIAEIWVVDEDGLALAAVFRQRDGAARSPSADHIEQALAEPVALDDWYALPIPGTGDARGVLAVLRPDPWTSEDEDLAHALAAVVGVGLAAGSQPLDEAARDQFLALLGHDLRSPLSNVRIGAQLARRNLEAGDTESVQEALRIIETQSGRLVARLEALLDAVAASGRQLMRLETLDLGAMAAETIEPFRLAVDETGAGTKFSLDVEPGTSPIRGDAVQIGQVLEHLLDNAAKYAAGGHVEVTVRPEGGMVRVDVCDDGPGIRPADVDRVFMPFGRGHAGGNREGYGLGLYLARNVAEAHGGRLWIARTSRSGTCMALALPSAADAADPAEA